MCKSLATEIDYILDTLSPSSITYKMLSRTSEQVRALEQENSELKARVKELESEQNIHPKPSQNSSQDKR